MSQVTGMVPGMKKEEEVPDVAPQEGEYQEYTVNTSRTRINFNEQEKITLTTLTVSCSCKEYFIESF